MFVCWQNLLQEFGFSKLRMRMLYVIEIPTLISLIMGTQLYFESHLEMLSTQSFLWIPNVTLADPYFVFPLLAAGLFGLRIEVSPWCCLWAGVCFQNHCKQCLRGRKHWQYQVVVLCNLSYLLFLYIDLHLLLLSHVWKEHVDVHLCKW